MDLVERENYLVKLNKIEKKFRLSKFKKFLKYPLWTVKVSILSRVLHSLLRDKIPVNSKVKLFFGEEMYLTYPPNYDIKFYNAYFGGDFEVKLTKFLIRNLSNGDIFFDIGANQGYYSILASKLVGDKGKVVAFEPDPNAFKILQKNKRDNIIILNYAVSNINSKIPFYSFGVLSTLSSLVETQVKEIEIKRKIKPSIVTVNAITLDSFCSDYKIFPNYIRLDIEGSEVFALKGAEEILNKQNLVIISEIWFRNSKIYTLHKEAVEFLTKLGYKSYMIDDDGNLKFLNDLEEAFISAKKFSEFENELIDNLVFVKS